MPMRRDAYPDNWDEIALEVKTNANWVCADCGMQCRRPGEPFDTHKRTMSVAHLDHNPMNCDPDNLRGWCSACHLRYDAPLHAQHAAETRRRKVVERGQLELEL